MSVGIAYMRPDFGTVGQSYQNNFQVYAWYYQGSIEEDDYLDRDEVGSFVVALV